MPNVLIANAKTLTGEKTRIVNRMKAALIRLGDQQFGRAGPGTFEAGWSENARRPPDPTKYAR